MSTTEHDTMAQARAALLQAVAEGAGQKDAIDRAAEMLGGRYLLRGDLHQVWKVLVEERQIVRTGRRFRVAEDATAAGPRVWSAQEVVAVLKRCRHTADPDWVFLDEVRIGTGYSNDADKRLDAWAIHCLPSRDNERICYEVKVSRSDFRHEIRKPLKRRHGLLWSNKFYFVAPRGVIPAEEVPAECGLLEVVGDDPATAKLLTTIKAPRRDSMWPTWNFFAAVARRMRVANEAEQLRAELKQAHQQGENLDRELQSANLNLQALRRLLQAFGRQNRDAFAALVDLVETDVERRELARQFESGWWNRGPEVEADRAIIDLLYPDSADSRARWR